MTASSTRRADLAMQMGASVFVPPHEDPVGEVNRALGGPPEVVFECVGMPGLIERYASDYPDVKLKVKEMETEQILTALRHNEIDAAIVSTPLQESGIQEYPLFYEPFVGYFPEGSPVLKKRMILPADIDMEKLLLLNEGHCMRNQVLNICKDKFTMGDNKNLEYNTGSVETLKRMVDLNEGYTILPELSLQDLSTRQLNMVRYFKAPEPVREISLVTHRHFIKQALIEAFKKEILAHVPDKMKAQKNRKVIEILNE